MRTALDRGGTALPNLTTTHESRTQRTVATPLVLAGWVVAWIAVRVWLARGSVAVPAYLWGRRMLSRGHAAAAAATALLAPAFVLTRTLMQENAFLSAFVLASIRNVLARARVRVRRTETLGLPALHPPFLAELRLSAGAGRSLARFRIVPVVDG